MQRLTRSIIALTIGLGLCLPLGGTASAGYGNHAERATENIMTRVGLAKIRIELEIAEIQAVAAEKAPARP